MKKKRRSSNNTDSMKSIDWNCLNREKAEFIYKEAGTVIANIHMQNRFIQSKALMFMTLVASGLVLIAPYLVSQFHVLDRVTLISGIVFIFLLFSSAGVLIASAWPRSHYLEAPHPRLILHPKEELYKKPMTEMLCQIIPQMQGVIDEESLTLKKRTARLKYGTVLLYAAPLSASVFVLVRVFLLTR